MNFRTTSLSQRVPRCENHRAKRKIEVKKGNTKYERNLSHHLIVVTTDQIIGFVTA